MLHIEIEILAKIRIYTLGWKTQDGNFDPQIITVEITSKMCFQEKT